MNQQSALAEISTQCIYHVIFPTYKRLPILLNEQYRIEVIQFIRDVTSSHNIVIITSKVLTDHVHLLIQKQSGQLLPYLIQTIKGVTTHKFFKRYPEIKIDIQRGKLWARGYHQTLIQSEAQLHNTINYINNNYDCYRDEPTV